MKSSARFLFVLAILFAALHSHAQISVKGRLMAIEKQENTPLPYATIRLLAEKDSAFVSGTNTDLEGFFIFKNLPPKNYLVQVTFIGYKTQTLPANPGKGNEINLGEIIIRENSVELAEAVVVAQRTEMTVKTDTMEYNADAYKMKENAVVEDLLKRLPGVTLSDEGEILINGKPVTKIMVDGKDFFKSNPTLSVKNIPVEIMEKLQVIDDKSELAKLTGVDDGEENTVINITIKKGKKKGWLVNASGGLGQEVNSSENNLMRYTVNSFAARLVEDTQFGIVANGNNINNQNIGGGASTSAGGQAGLNSFLNGGFNFSSGSDKKNAPYYVNTDITYGFTDRLTKQNSNRQYYLQDSTSYERDTLLQRRRSHGLRVNTRFDYRAIKGWTFSFTPSATFQTSDNEYQRNTHTIAGSMKPVNNSFRSSTSSAPNFNIGGTFTVVRQFEKKGRRLSMSVDARYYSSDSEGYSQSKYFYNNRSLEKQPDTTYQKTITDNNTLNTRLYLSYIEPLGKTGRNSLQFVYWARAYNQENIKLTHKRDKEGEFSILDLPYSKSIENLTITQQLGMRYRGFIQKINLIYTAGIDVNPTLINSRSFIKNGSKAGSDSTLMAFDNRFTLNYAPNAYLLYNIKKGTSLRFDYRGRSEAPSITQLDPTPNETNPLNVRMGNPNLNPKFTHWGRFRFVDFNRETQQSIQLQFEGRYIENDIVNFTEYEAETGKKTTYPVNQSGSWSTNMLFNYSRPLGKLFQINNYTNVGFRNNIGFSIVPPNKGSEMTIATTASFTEDIGLTFKYDWLYMFVKGIASFGNTSYSLQSMVPKQTLDWRAIYNVQVSLPSDWSVSSEIAYRGYMGFSEQDNRNELLWNAEISKSFLKNKAATLCLRLNDILQQQLSIAQVISSNYVENQYSNTLSSFVMLSFSYRFNTMGKEK